MKSLYHQFKILFWKIMQIKIRKTKQNFGKIKKTYLNKSLKLLTSCMKIIMIPIEWEIFIKFNASTSHEHTVMIVDEYNLYRYLNKIK